MNLKPLYLKAVLFGLFLIPTHKGWGSDHKSLPHPILIMASSDTVPPVKPAEVKPAENKPANPALPVEKIIDPVIKVIPKSRKQIKPVAIPGNIPAKTQKIIKPKIIIRRIGSLAG